MHYALLPQTLRTQDLPLLLVQVVEHVRQQRKENNTITIDQTSILVEGRTTKQLVMGYGPTLMRE